MFLPESLIYFLQLSFTQSAVIYGFKGPGSMLVHMLCSPNQVSGQTTGCKFLRTICLLINNESSHVLFDTCSDLLVNQSRVSSSVFFFLQCNVIVGKWANKKQGVAFSWPGVQAENQFTLKIVLSQVTHSHLVHVGGVVNDLPQPLLWTGAHLLHQ